MGIDVAIGSSPARVRSTFLSKDVARAAPAHPVFSVVAPIAPPRLWSSITQLVGDAFEKTLDDARQGVVGMQRAVGAGAQSLVRFHSALVEPGLSLDAQLVALAIVGDAAHVAISSGMRIYRARNGEPKRLLTNAQRSPGISQGGMLVSTERLLRGDLFVFGSRDGFGMRSIGAVATMLAQRPDAPSVEICEAALAPCRGAGIGAGLAVVRVR